MIQRSPKSRCFELTIDGFPTTPVDNHDELKARVGLSREFLYPEQWTRMQQALTEQERSSAEPSYVKFLTETDLDGQTVIIWVHSQVHRVLVDVRQRSFGTSLSFPAEVFHQAICDGLRAKIKDRLLAHGVRIP